METELSELVEEIKSTYRPRIIDAKLLEKLSIFGGVLITGPRSCGKSWTGLYHSKSAVLLGEAKANALAELDPQHALSGEYPRTVDEWQDVPTLWDVAKRNIDLKHKRGMYIFTGSSMPPHKKMRHTGVNRIARLQMRTMSLYESGESSGAVSLSSLFDTGKTEISHSKLNYKKTIGLICKGGWPIAMGLDDDAAIGISYEYIESVKEMDTARVDGIKRSSTTMGLVLKSLARNNATTASIPLITADVRSSGGKFSEQTVRSYVDVLKKVFVIEEQGAWHPSLRSRTRVRASPKRHFTDPSLAAAVLGARPNMLMQDTNTAGFLFESLCYRDLSTYATASGGRVFHYRDDSDLEVDAVVQLDDGRWGAVEVKLGSFEFEKAAANLIRMKKKMTDAGVAEPSFLMILNATGGVAHTRPDGITEVPIDCLGP